MGRAGEPLCAVAVVVVAACLCSSDIVGDYVSRMVAFQFRRILSNQLPLVVHAPQRMVFPAGAVWLQGFAPTLHNDNLHAKSLFIAKLPGSIRLDLASSGPQGSHCELAAVLPLFCRSAGHERAGRAG